MSAGVLEAREPSSFHSFEARESESSGEAQRSHTIVGLVPAILVIIAFSGIAIFLIIRKRLPSKSSAHTGYSRASTRSTDPYLNSPRGRIDWSKRGYRYDPESMYELPPRAERNPIYREIARLDTSDVLLTVPRYSTLMQSATSPPPFSYTCPAKHDSLPSYNAHPRAELEVESIPAEKENVFGVPALPSIWPSGWTERSKTSSAQDQEPDDDLDKSSILGKEEAVDGLFVTNERELPHDHAHVQSTPPRIYHTAHSDDEHDEIETLELEIARLIEDNKEVENSKPSFFSLHYGLSRSSTKRSQCCRSQAPSRVPSLVQSARLAWGRGATPLDHDARGNSDSVLGGFMGRLAASFSARATLRQPGYEHVALHEENYKVAETRSTTMSPESSSLGSPSEHIDFPPTPPAPPTSFQSFGMPFDAQPLIASYGESKPYHEPVSSGLPSTRPAPSMNGSGHVRLASGSSTTIIRPLPVLPGSD
ncbi:hypothetical protein RhiJN_07015 [Ceratobasidium sp. AG-Ba]|nr:hypothetical protein RhiJN_07015 [Ceratobasidium sp. AG-Ba]QRW07895.1 hypothetical protein RhiLY_06894 [Ceratobasidium sp. AG-Ba]